MPTRKTRAPWTTRRERRRWFMLELSGRRPIAYASGAPVVQNSGTPTASEMSMRRVFLLSPAHCGGKRAGLVLNEQATFDLATRLRAPRGVAIGDVFTFLSGLYFRGKLAYARHFACAPEGADGVLVITPTRGLVPPERPVTLAALREFATVDVD